MQVFSVLTLLDLLSLGHVSPIPKLQAEHRPAKVRAGPPPPPPRKYFPAESKECIAPEKPPRVMSTDLQTFSLLAQQVEDNGRHASNCSIISSYFC